MICKIPALIQNETEMGEKRGKRPGMRRREREIRGKRVMGERERERERDIKTSNVCYNNKQRFCNKQRFLQLSQEILRKCLVEKHS